MNKYGFIVLYSSNKYILYVNYNFMVKKLEHKQQKQYCNKFKEDLELKTKTKNYHRPSNLIPGHILRETHNSKRCMHSNVHCSTIYNSQDIEAT